MRILPAGGANCHCRSAGTGRALFYSRVPDAIVHPVRTDECDNIHESVVLSDKLLTRITMSRAVHVVPTSYFCIFYRLYDFRLRLTHD